MEVRKEASLPGEVLVGARKEASLPGEVSVRKEASLSAICNPQLPAPHSSPGFSPPYKRATLIYLNSFAVKKSPVNRSHCPIVREEVASINPQSAIRNPQFLTPHSIPTWI